MHDADDVRGSVSRLLTKLEATFRDGKDIALRDFGQELGEALGCLLSDKCQAQEFAEGLSRGLTIHESSSSHQVSRDWRIHVHENELADQEGEVERLRDDCAELYQIFGCIMISSKVEADNDSDIEKVLDNLDAALAGEPKPHHDILPWPTGDIRFRPRTIVKNPAVKLA